MEELVSLKMQQFLQLEEKMEEVFSQKDIEKEATKRFIKMKIENNFSLFPDNIKNKFYSGFLLQLVTYATEEENRKKMITYGRGRPVTCIYYPVKIPILSKDFYFGENFNNIFCGSLYQYLVDIEKYKECIPNIFDNPSFIPSPTGEKRTPTLKNEWRKYIMDIIKELVKNNNLINDFYDYIVSYEEAQKFYDEETLRLIQIKNDYLKSEEERKVEELRLKEIEASNNLVKKYFNEIFLSDFSRHFYEENGSSNLYEMNRNKGNKIYYMSLVWDYVKDNGGFLNCPTCNKVPEFVGYFDTGYRPKFEEYRSTYDLFELYNVTGWEGRITGKKSIKVERLECCEHMFDIKSKKRYIKPSSVKYFLGEPIKFQKSSRIWAPAEFYSQTEKYIEYNPEDPNGEKAFKNKTYKDLKTKYESSKKELDEFLHLNPEFLTSL